MVPLSFLFNWFRVFAVRGGLCLVVGLTACAPGGGDPDSAVSSSPNAPSRLHIVATTGMIGDLARDVAGDLARVDILIAPGIDPHLFSPTRSDVALLQQADIIFYNGYHLEGRMGGILRTLDRPGHPVVPIAERLDPSLHSDTPRDDVDPHLWMDASLWQRLPGEIATVLGDVDPSHAALYRERSTRLRARLEALHQDIADLLAGIPPDHRVLVTAHDAFRYFGRAYGLDVRGIQGISTESEAGIRGIEALIDLLVDRRIPAVFAETSIADKNVRALLEGTRARGHSARLGGRLFSDAMGPLNEYTGTYIGMMDHNATTIARALGADTPARGLYGQLPEAPAP